MREHKNKNKEKNLKGVTPCKLFLHLETRTEVFCNLVYWLSYVNPLKSSSFFLDQQDVSRKNGFMAGFTDLETATSHQKIN